MMGSYANFENFASMGVPDGKTAVSYPLTRQGSIYAMTFDELQTMGSLGRDIGSLNMEELLKNLWTAEEIQANATVGGGSCNAPCPSGNLQRQGSLTLPRTISQKTVDDVWKELLKESGGSKDETDGKFSNMFQRDPTLGEITLEEFLARAGVVREEIQPFEKPGNASASSSHANKPIEKPNNAGYSGGFTHTNGLNNHGVTHTYTNGHNNGVSQTNGHNNNSVSHTYTNGHNNGVGHTNGHNDSVTHTYTNGHNNSVPHTNGHNNGFTIDFQQPSPNRGMLGKHSPNRGMLGNPYKGNNNEFCFNLALNGNRAMSPSRQQHPQSETHLQPLYPKQATLASPQPSRSRVTNSVVVANSSLNSPTTVTQSGIMGMANSGVTNSVGGMSNALNSPRAVSHNGMMNVASSGVSNGMTNALSSPIALGHNGMMNVANSGMANSGVGMANALNSPRAVSHNGMMNVASSGMTNSVRMANASLSSPRTVARSSGLVNMAGLHGVTTTVPGGSPRNHQHPDTSSKNSLDSPSQSSSPYAYNEGGQGRRSSATLEKQVERRRRRMIKNRESAARSRARKQEYITELESEIAKLKEINRGLKEKQVELMNMQKNQEPESGKDNKRKRLRRTLTGQW